MPQKCGGSAIWPGTGTFVAAGSVARIVAQSGRLADKLHPDRNGLQPGTVRDKIVAPQVTVRQRDSETCPGGPHARGCVGSRGGERLRFPRWLKALLDLGAITGGGAAIASAPPPPAIVQSVSTA